MNRRKVNLEERVDSLQKRLEELAIEKEMLVLRIKKAYVTLEDIKGSRRTKN